MEFYPVSPADAIPAGRASGGPPPGIVAVRPGDLRKPGLGGVSALVTVPPAGRPFAITSGEELVFCHQVTVAPAVVRRSGEVQAGGWLPAHVTLGVLEAYLPDGEIEALVEDFGCAEERQRLLPAAMAVRMVIVMTLMPDAPVPEVICRAAGLLAYLPWARPWHVPGTEALTRRLGLIPAELFEALFWVVAGPIADPAGNTEAGMTWRGLLLCALDGFLVRVPDTEANREYFSSSGTADNSSPFPQVRAIIVTAARTKGALGMEFGPSSDGEQTLTRRLVKARPHLFGKGRLILMDRNFPGFALIKAIREQGAHLLMRMKSGIALPLLKALPDGSYQSFLSDGADRIPVRVVEYDVQVPGRDGAGDELYALATTVTDWQAYPAAELAACYPDRWAAVETVIGEDKSAITDAGPSRGPILRSSSPHQVTQEMWAWMTATQLVRIQGHQAIQASAADPGRQPQTPVTPARVSFTAGRREAVRAMTQTLVTANVSAAVLAAAAELASQRILARLLPVRPPRHRERRTKCRQQFPSATGRVPASTGKAAVTIYPAGQITYADGHTAPAACPAAGDTS